MHKFAVDRFNQSNMKKIFIYCRYLPNPIWKGPNLQIYYEKMFTVWINKGSKEVKIHFNYFTNLLLHACH